MLPASFVAELPEVIAMPVPAYGARAPDDNVRAVVPVTGDRAEVGSGDVVPDDGARSLGHLDAEVPIGRLVITAQPDRVAGDDVARPGRVQLDAREREVPDQVAGAAGERAADDVAAPPGFDDDAVVQIPERQPLDGVAARLDPDAGAATGSC